MNDNAVLAALIGSALTGAVALGAQFLSNRHQRIRDLRDQRSARIAEFLGASHACVLILGVIAEASEHEKATAIAALRSGPSDRFNTARFAISLLEPGTLIRVADDLDDALSRHLSLAVQRQWSREEWYTERAGIVDKPVEEVLAEGRRQLVALERAV